LNTVRKNSVVVGFDEGNLPTSDKKGFKVDYDAFSSTLVSDTIGTEDYILYSVVFGDYAFPDDPEVIKHRDSSLRKEMKIPNKHPCVYRIGIASGFRGLLTSLKNFVLIGFGNPPVPPSTTLPKGGFDTTRKVLHPIMVPYVATMKEWYKFVGTDCSTQAMMFFCPVGRYSGISNLLRQSKDAAVMQLRIVPMEDGLSIPSGISRVETVKKQPVVDFSAVKPVNMHQVQVVTASLPSANSSTTSSSSSVSSSLGQSKVSPMVNFVPSSYTGFPTSSSASSAMMEEKTPVLKPAEVVEEEQDEDFDDAMTLPDLFEGAPNEDEKLLVQENEGEEVKIKSIDDM